MHQIRTIVAIKVQRIWRKFFKYTVIPRRQHHLELSVTYIIQKACRGYLDRKKILADRNQQKMELNFEYFDKIRHEMQFDAVIKIGYQYKRYQAKKRKKRMDAEARKLAAKGKNKYGVPNKTTFKKAGTVVKNVTAALGKAAPSPKGAPLAAGGASVKAVN